MATWGGSHIRAYTGTAPSSSSRPWYSLVTNGLVDLNGFTRLQYSRSDSGSSGLGAARLFASVTMTAVAADFAGGLEIAVGVAMTVAEASLFSGTPTAAQVWNHPQSVRYVAQEMRTVPGTSVYNVHGPLPTQMNPATKYWVVVAPIQRIRFIRPGWTNPVWSDDGPVIGSSYRGISVWTNRRPEKPSLTLSTIPPQPRPVPIVNSGQSFSIEWSHLDPDRDGTEGSQDLSGVQFQYAPAPTNENPNPTWQDMRYIQADGEDGWVPAWYIVGSPYQEAKDGGVPIIGLPTSIPVATGGLTAPSSSSSLFWLPAGAWQIRCRTFDFGHPFTSAPPLSISMGSLLYPDRMPDTNRSPWSDPASIVVNSQVPPPVPVSPVLNTAISEDLDITLTWRYRSAHTPPLSQTERIVQVRKVGDANWTTVVRDGSSESSYTLGTPPEGRIIGGILDFDGGESLGNWEQFAAGLNYLESTSYGVTTAPFKPLVNPNILLSLIRSGLNPGPVGPKFVTIRGWLRGYAYMSHTAAVFNFSYLGSSVSDLEVEYTGLTPGLREDPEPFSITFNTTGRVDKVDIRTLFNVDYNDTTEQMLAVSELIVHSTYDVGTSTPFPVEATTQYEWRVRVYDAEGVPSDWSAPARFWVVPTPASGGVMPVPSDTIEGATLGCGTHRVFVYRRGGERRVAEITNISRVEWSRVRDDISEARIDISGWDLDCGNLLASLQSWAYEIVIYRDNGYSSERVWEGPITQLTYEADKVTIKAKDMMGYVFRRIIKQAMNDYPYPSSVVDRAKRILQNVFAPDDPNILAYLQPQEGTAAIQRRSVPAFARTAFEEIDDMASNAGLDYTVVGRSILLWGTRDRIGLLPEFRDEDLGSAPIVSEYGMSAANFYAVSNGNGIYGVATRLDENGEDPVYGNIEVLSSTWNSDGAEDGNTGIVNPVLDLQETTESYNEYAERIIADRYPPPTVVRVPDNTTLNPDTVISIQHLVPGVAIPLRSSGTLRHVRSTQKLDAVRVIEESGKETISIILSPFSRQDNEMGETEG